MKLKLLFIFGLSLSGFVLLTSTSSGRAAGANQGNTGAPGDNSRTCVSCHNTGRIDVDLSITLLDEGGNEVSAYKPNQTYTVRVQIDDVGSTPPSGWGFQMVCLNAPLDVDGEDLENWVDMGPNNYKIASARGRSYAEHAGVSNENIFDVQWTAPDVNTGTVSFYAAGNGVNFNGGTSGDGADTDKIEISEDFSSSTADLWQNSIQVSPNPARSETQVTWPDNFQGNLILMNLMGQTVNSYPAVQGNSLSLDLNSLKSGLYLVKFAHENGSSKTVRLIKR